ncbi:ABC transporter ATP-binding protein [Haloimpatiens sp. FM7330]|uniref:ABC transporter ATP-binding protein n=1 Tax=Haloimpatiens sp. FM7330 TaxID=3298610 RepID=UPI0036389C37
MRKVLVYLKPYMMIYILAGALIMMTTFADLALPGIMKDIVNIGISSKDTVYIIHKGLIMLLITLFNLTCWVLASYFDAKASFYFARDLRKDVFSHVIDSSVDQTDKTGTASLINRTTNDIANLEFSTFRILRMGTIAPFTCIGGIILAFRTSVEISGIFVLAAVLLAFICYVIISKATPFFKFVFPKTDAVNRVLRENLTGIRVIRAFNKDHAEKKRFNSANEDLTETNIKAQKIMAWHSPLITLIMNLTIIAILYFGAVKIDEGTFLPGELIAMIQYATLILGAFIRLSMVFQMLPRYNAAAKRVSELLYMKNTLKEPHVKEINKPINSSISFSHVIFNYGNAQNAVIDDVSFSAESGKTTAIIGGTGSGKSTIMQLILRFYDAKKGSIMIGGVDIRDMKKNKLRSYFGYAAQEAELFSGSIAQNLSYGCRDFNEGAIKEVARIAQAEDFIMDKSDGYSASIAQNGKNFSGGQRQRLSIARALARKPKILLFDDSFSALDFKTDAKLRKAIKEKFNDTTVLIIAQRIATVMDADKIIVLNEGKVEDVGTHDELINRCIFYKELALSQLSKEEVLI